MKKHELRTTFVVSRSYGDETKYFPVAATTNKRTANALTRAFGGIITEVPHFFSVDAVWSHEVVQKEDEDE